MEHPDFEMMCAALESYSKSLAERCDDMVVEETEQLVENAFEMLRQSEVLASNHCPDPECGNKCIDSVSEHEDFTLNYLTAHFVLNTDEGELCLELRDCEGGLMEVTEWIKCKATEENGLIYYSTGRVVPRLLKALASQIVRKSKLAGTL